MGAACVRLSRYPSSNVMATALRGTLPRDIRADVPPMPELQHEDAPDDVTVERGSIRRVEAEEVIEGAGPEVGPDVRAWPQQRIVGQIREARMGAEPEARRDSEAVLALGQGLGRKQLGKRLLEQVALLPRVHLEVRRPGGGELDEGEIEEREADPHAGRFRGARDLEQVVVADRELHVQVHQPVELRPRGDPGEVLVQHVPRSLRVDGREKVPAQQIAAVLSKEELVRVEPTRIRQAGPADVPLGPTHEGRAAVGKRRQDRLEERAAQNPWNLLIAAEHRVDGVALVSSEDLVAPIAGEQAGDAALPRHLGAQERTDAGVVSEWL